MGEADCDRDPGDVAARSRIGRSRFFLIASIVMSAIVFAGFLPSFYFRPVYRETGLPLSLIVHGVVMTAWQLLFVTQTVLIAAGRTDLHRRLGVVGAALAVGVVAVGVQATLAQPARNAALGIELPFPVELLVVGNLIGFVVFAGLVAAAIRLRRDAAAHKRLIYWACVVTLGPALTAGRSLGRAIGPYFPTTFPPELAMVWVAWIALLLHDWRMMRRFHPVTIIGGMLILFVGMAVGDWLVAMEPVSAWVRSLA